MQHEPCRARMKVQRAMRCCGSCWARQRQVADGLHVRTDWLPNVTPRGSRRTDLAHRRQAKQPRQRDSASSAAAQCRTDRPAYERHCSVLQLDSPATRSGTRGGAAGRECGCKRGGEGRHRRNLGVRAIACAGRDGSPACSAQAYLAP